MTSDTALAATPTNRVWAFFRRHRASMVWVALFLLLIIAGFGELALRFLLGMRAQGIGHEATIEIGVALLGVMVMVLTLMAGLITLLIGVFAFYGYKAIEEQAIKKAGEVAKETSEKSIESGRLVNQSADVVQGVGPPARKIRPSGITARKMSDASLKKVNKNDSGRRDHQTKPAARPR